MTENHERNLCLLLRAVGSVALLAAFFVFVPFAWMAWIHQMLGMGQLPSEPVVGYLARSTSAFYAMLGGLFWVMSYDTRRYCPVLKYLGVFLVLIGLVLLGVDLIEGMPWWWSLSEGPFNLGFGLIILWLCREMRREQGDSKTGHTAT